MLTDRYDIIKSKREHVYEFFSDDPKGRIRKIIKFTIIELENVYNLGFGDEIGTSGKIDDLI